MKQYIDKAAVVAEIERRKQKLLDHIICESDKEWVVRTAHQLNRIHLFLDTLEVKEKPVSEDLEEAARIYSNNLDNIYGSIGEQARNAFKAGAKWQEEQMINKVCEWLKEQDEMVGVSFEEDFIERFKNYMKGE